MLVSGVVAGSLAVSPCLSAAAELDRVQYEACQAQDETSFRTAIETVTVRALREGTEGIDYRAAVAEEWRRTGVDEILDRRVDLAIADVRDETSWANLLQSLADEEKAKALATAVAEKVYKSEALTSAIEGLAAGVGRTVGKRIEAASQQAAEPVLQCLRAYLGPRYGATVAGVVTANASRDFELDPAQRGADFGSGSILKESGQGLTGAAILLVRRQLANMAQRVSQRIVGSVLGRLVSIVAGGVGLVLIAKDLWDFRHGVLPIIATEMKSKESKDRVQEELARSIGEQIGEHVKEIGTKAADRVIDVWQEFRRAHRHALDLAERDETFRRVLDGVKPEQYARLDETVALVLQSEGEAGLLRRAGDGSLAEVIGVMPPAAFDIARETRSLDKAMKWWRLAGDELGKVIAYELPKRADPDQFAKPSLLRLVALDDRLAITRLAALPRAARDVLFELGNDDLKTLARTLTEPELAVLAQYLSGLEAAARERVLRTVAAAPAQMQVLASAPVRDAILASRDQAAAVDMMLRVDGPLDPRAVGRDAELVAGGRVSPWLLWHKHPAAVVIAALALAALLLLLRRLFKPRRRAAAANPLPAGTAGDLAGKEDKPDGNITRP
jgi:hypothetical protein